MRAAPKVFISYSHDSPEHGDRVLDLANRLREDGIDAEIDQYESSPLEGWPTWCEQQIKAADFVLLVCTESYLRRVGGGEAPGIGHGVLWEARIIRQLLYDAGSVSAKFVPVLFSHDSRDHIPTAVKGAARFIVDDDNEYERLYRLLTAQPRVLKPVLGKPKTLPPKERKSRGSIVAGTSTPSPPHPDPLPCAGERASREKSLADVAAFHDDDALWCPEIGVSSHAVADATGIVATPTQDEQTLSSSMAVVPSDPVALFCAEAGLNPSLLADGAPADIMRKAGEIFRIAVEGFMAVLESRRGMKGEFRLACTEFGPAENNPLKFSVDAQAAMVMLIGKPCRGFLPAREAFEEVIDDIRMHEVAVLAGTQEAWFSLLQRFGPKELSQRLEDDGGLASLLVPKKARCWDAFTTLYDSIAGNADNEWERTFRSIFGSAYERSMQKQRQRLG